MIGCMAALTQISSKGEARPTGGMTDQGLPESSGLSLQLWQGCQAQVAVCLYDPFVRALAAGTLPR